MPTRRRNPDGSLSYSQTADEKLQNQSQQNVKQLMRTVKKLGERMDHLEASIRSLTEALNSVTSSLNKEEKKPIHAIL